jgi:selenocysteine lyase/cysteine desulfurase
VTSPVPELGCQRHLFEIPDDVAYLNCAYVSPSPRSVREAGERAVARTTRPWEITPPDFFADAETARELFARLVGGDADGVALIPAVSYGIATAAANLPVAEGANVVVLAEQFPSNVYPWWEVAPDVRTVPTPEAGTWTEGVLSAIDERTAVVAVPHCHWTDGRLVDLHRVGEAARAVDAALVVDATQSLGALRLDVDEVQPDFLVAAGYKWLLGPYRLGYMWVAPERREGRALEQTWIARAGSEDFAGLVDYRDDLQPGARRYDVGERSDFIALPMALAALRLLLEWEVDRTASAIAAHTARIEAATAEAGLHPLPRADRAGHMLGVTVPGGVPEGLIEQLAAAAVHVSVRGPSIRVSPHLWNTDQDIDRFLDVLTDLTSS